MKRFYYLLIPVLILLVQGCAPIVQKPVSLDTGFWQERKGVIGIAIEPVPSPDTHFLDNQGLLDIAVNSANAKPMGDRLKAIDTKRAGMIAENLANRLTARGFTVKQLAAPVDSTTLPEWKSPVTPELYALRDFSPLKKEGIDRLLIITVESVGTERNYYGFFPLGPPRAVFKVKGQLVDLETRKLLWFQRDDSTMPIPEPWDQSPDFANVVTTVSNNLEDTASRFERSFFGTQVAATAQ